MLLPQNRFLPGILVSFSIVFLIYFFSSSQPIQPNNQINHLVQIISKLEAQTDAMHHTLKAVQAELEVMRERENNQPPKSSSPSSVSNEGLLRGVRGPIIVGEFYGQPPFMFSIPNFPHFGGYRSEMVSQGKINADLVTGFQKLMRGKPEGSIFMDVGCNVGLSAFPIAAMGYRVICIEPIKGNLAYVRQGVNANGFEKLVTVVEGAASNVTGKTIIYVPENYGDNASLGEKTAVQNVHTTATKVEVELFTLDNYLQQHKTTFQEDQVAVLKIDVQGFETEVIQGAAAFLKKHRSIDMSFEYDPKLIASSGHFRLPLLKLVDSLGFKIYDSPGGSLIPPEQFENFATNDQRALDLFATKGT